MVLGGPTVVQLLGWVVLVDVEGAAVYGAREVLCAGLVSGFSRGHHAWTYIAAVLDTPYNTVRVHDESDLVPNAITEDIAISLVVVAVSRCLALVDGPSPYSRQPCRD